jgi:cephalosporin-C deacetylase-like acetyl esterase
MPSRFLCVAVLFAVALPASAAEQLPDTKPLPEQGDLAAKMVEGIDKYLMREIAASVDQRNKSKAPNRDHLKKIIGVVDQRAPVIDLEYVSSTKTPALVAETDAYKVFAVRWPVLPGVDGEGLLLEPKGKALACAVAIPDADWTPEMLVGLAPGVPAEAQTARILAENGCRVLVPVLIDRKDDWSGNPALERMTNQPHREFIYRMAYEMGRHVIGYEVQKVFAAVDWFCRDKDHPPVSVVGCGEGGMIALYSGALDDRIQETIVGGYFGPRESCWEEPIYRNVWNELREFGDAGIARLILPRRLTVVMDPCVEIAGPPPDRSGRAGAAPGRITAPSDRAAVRRELDAAGTGHAELVAAAGPAGEREAVMGFLSRIRGDFKPRTDQPAPKDLRKDFDPAPRQHRQFDQLVQFTQKLLRDSERRRQETFWSKLNTSSLEKYEASCKPFREQLDEEVIGKLPKPTEAMNPRTRLLYDEPKYRAYEVMLDIYPDVYAYGILALPKDLKPGEKRPVVVCQHGLEGRPTDVICPNKNSQYYHSFGSRLAELGYIVYAPQNPYIGHDKFRVLQRKANPLGLSLFSFIVRQHRTTLDWLSTLPNVDAKRIAFYGLSYGGKTAMRVPALETRYCLSICSGDFNEWVAKNASVDFAGSYMFSMEYEMPEWNLGHTFNYAEMAALIAPRPFMVERGHNDGVGIDEMVAYEYAKVRRLYSRLKIPERTEIEYFDGPHEIHGVGTFAFLKKQLKWPPG